MNIRKLPIGIQSFESLREDGYLYVDKTAFVYQLVHTGKTYFLSRPRRFGKSLLLSTLRAYFEGRKELFDGLKIIELEQDNPDAWKKYPVLYFDFNGQNYKNSGSLESVLDDHLKVWEKLYEVNDTDKPISLRFKTVIEAAYEKTGLGVVVLVDEYDKSLLETDNEILEANRALFKGFFGNLKSMDRYLKFSFITGVTRFSKVSIFSDLNQLRDISLSKDYAEICGITEEEMEVTFSPEIESLADEKSLTRGECLTKLQQMYDGYHFASVSKGVYNPFSLINSLCDKDFASYWFATGTPTFLVNKLQTTNYDARLFTSGEITTNQNALGDYRTESSDPIPLFYQSGYLTIKGYDKRHDMLILGYPNEEVKYSFLQSLTPMFMRNDVNSTVLSIDKFDDDMHDGNLESVMDRFKALFARLPYTTQTGDAIIEQNFQNVIYLVFMLMGQFTKVEQHYAQGWTDSPAAQAASYITSNQSQRGSVDCEVETADTVYIFEFKRDRPVDEALQQIEQKQYAASYAADPRKVVKVGVSFSSEQRNIVDWRAV